MCVPSYPGIELALIHSGSVYWALECEASAVLTETEPQHKWKTIEAEIENNFQIKAVLTDRKNN